MIEDRIRVAEKEHKTSDIVDEEDDLGPGNDTTDYTHGSDTRWVYIRVGG